jgi:ABC-2 type transport system permease protein
MMTLLETIYNTFKLQLKQSFARPTYKYCLIIQPILYTVITYMMFKNSGQTNFVSYVILGTGILTLWTCVCFSSAGDIERERFMGTLLVIYCTPTNFKIIVVGKILANTILGMIPFVISFASVKVFFQGEIYVKEPIAFLVSMIITIISFVSISLVFSAFFTLSRSAVILMNCIEYPIFILCGILFPIEMLPRWTNFFSYMLSPTWAVRILRMSIDGISNKGTFYSYLSILIAITIFYFIFSNILFNVIDKKTRIKGTLGVS